MLRILLLWNLFFYMFNNYLIYSPLEIFNINIFYTFYLSLIDLSISNYFIFLIISSNIIIFANKYLFSNKIIINNIQFLFYWIYNSLYFFLIDIITIIGNKYLRFSCGCNEITRTGECNPRVIRLPKFWAYEYDRCVGQL